MAVPLHAARPVHLARMGGDAGAMKSSGAGRGRSRYRRHLLPALADDSGETGRRQGGRDIGYPASLPRRLGPRRRPHAARLADRIEGGRFRQLARRAARHIPASPWRAARRPGIRRSRSPSRAARRARRDSRCGVFADQIDQRGAAEFVRQLPGAGLVQPHQRRVQFELPGHAEIERGLQRLDGRRCGNPGNRNNRSRTCRRRHA